MTRSVADGLRAVGVDHARVTDVILTHLHWDHAGNLGLFGSARFHLSEQELRFAVGRAMTDPARSHGYRASDVAGAARLLREGRVRFTGEDEELFPGISVHLVGGHTAGTQVVRIATRRGPVVLASDAAHFYANLSEKRVFPVTDDAATLLGVYAHRLPALVGSTLDIVPGHDPLVLRRYRPAQPRLRGWVARLDQPSTRG
ncbi:glyoxylase-like metal-dependent hydrolase (beta-lactamase superfamily II) [Amycolatopsis bartoniae]|uniref:N-acyl homoserine lactonase family protein n=1 Tax=Amycolatopsis bartoniae TaxID=941986 RepID=UPI0017F7D108|nr:N-acyl homoserine lactonase family protein [Amycolatopsis bartoniae]MBB2938615.1 glyoxylase-like metal-dependent hydrolase (beta-lactamase superfamily II) [Amycolatopsis bartoniae]